MRAGRLSRRDFLALGGAALGALLPISRSRAQGNWRDLLFHYTEATESNIVVVNGRRALLSSRLYPGTYVRDAVFWGPLALNDPALGWECYQWFAESPLESGQIRTAIPLYPDEESLLTPQDDEGSLLFVMASDWLARAGYSPDTQIVERAYAWTQTHVQDERYVSQPGPFRYWADTVNPDTAETISHNQGLLCLARRAMVSMGLGGVTGADVQAAQDKYRALYDAVLGYVPLGAQSNFASAQDISAIFPEFLSRYLYDEAILDDSMVVSHVERILGNASVNFPDGTLAGVKVISASDGSFLPPEMFFAPGLNPPGRYQNGGYWPMYTLVALALAYSITQDSRYETIIGTLVTGELAFDWQSKEVIWLSPGEVGYHNPDHANYTWNALIRTAIEWCGLA